ncbi:MAG: vitamin K epoxide reductase family protein [Anaerolineaceae bacterium]
MEYFVSALQKDTLAIIVLAVLIMSGITSLLLMRSSKPVPTTKSGYSGLLSILSLLGLPAIIDLLQTSGITRIFAFVVLIVLLLNMIIPVLALNQKLSSGLVMNWFTWSIPVVIAGGFIVAGYLTYVEMTTAPAVCGVAIPGCVVVQTSSYSKLFGFLPIGIIGLLGYTAILAAWFLRKYGTDSLKKICSMAIWGMCLFGVLFSAYLTYLEAFVIRATCSWCITSAVLMILLLWVSTPAAQGVFLENEDDDN